MNQYTHGLIVFHNILSHDILHGLIDLFSRVDMHTTNASADNGLTRTDITEIPDISGWQQHLRNELHHYVHQLLALATTYGFNDNLWQNYLAWLLAMSENPFSLACEKKAVQTGSVNQFVLHDLRLIRNWLHDDFADIEKKLSTDCLSVLTHYQALDKDQKNYNWQVSQQIQALSQDLATATDETDMLSVLTAFYREQGAGMLGLNRAFRLQQVDEQTDSGFKLEPITNTVEVTLDDLVGYSSQKKRLIENTEAFIAGRKANNLLLHGESGTGKSTCIKAILNMYHAQGLRIIEIYKHQLHALSSLIATIKNRRYKFIIYMDDLSFEEFETEYIYLKAVIEGGLEMTPDNILIYATSNRRHIIKETWTDRSDVDPDDIHQSDTKEEKNSLVNRFGVTIYFPRPDLDAYLNIVRGIARQYPELQAIPDDLLISQARQWGHWHGSVSGRRARQFVHHLLGTLE